MQHWGRLRYEDMKNGRDFELLEPLWFRLNEIERIMVPKGFVTDKASIPSLFHPLFPKDGPYTSAAFVHDYLYAGEFLPRKKCDDIFLFAMDTLEVPAARAYIMYCAVRAFGQWHHTARSVAQVRSLAGYFTGDCTVVDPLSIKRPLFGNDMKVIF